MKNPFKIERIYTTTLTPEQIRAVIRSKVSESGFFALVRVYRGYYRSRNFLVLSQTVSKSAVAVKIRGIVLSSESGTRLQVTYQPACSPLYILVPLFLFFFYANSFSEIDTINGKSATWLEGFLFSVGLFSLIAATVSLINFRSLRKERELLESQLELKYCKGTL